MIKLLQDLLLKYLHIPSKYVNLYTLTYIPFGLFMLCFADNTLIDSYKLNETLKDYEDEKAYYMKQIEKTKADKIDLETNLEKYAREKFKMHKDNEEIFIIERK
jgi:cell division protein DivIC